MRVADIMAYDQVNRALARNRGELDKYQNEAATEKRLNKPSDDPVAAARVLGARTDERSVKQFIKNLHYAKSFLNYSAQALGDLDNILIRAKELAIGQANDGSTNPETRRSTAEEVKQLYNESIQIANRQLGDRFIFGGFKTVHPPFDENGNYYGDNGEIRIQTGKDSFVAMNIPGSVAFLGDGFSTDGMTFHDLSQARTLQQLKNQEANNPAQFGENKNGEPNPSDVVMRNPASLQISNNVAPTDGGPATQTDKNGMSVLGALKKFQIALMTNDTEGIQQSIDTLGAALQQVVVARASLGSRETALNKTLNSMHTQQIDDKETISQLEDADAFHVISEINKAQGALKATLETSGKLLQKSLMDFVQP